MPDVLAAVKTMDMLYVRSELPAYCNAARDRPHGGVRAVA
jgi:hypothetical protein